tara:strand:- start:1811 stop:2029 length:219 start_codon:yes stop_codon:yes gene_type:complete
MDQISSEEIISILAMHGRPDLIQEFKEHIRIDEDYKPPFRGRNDSLSDDEGSATSEEEYQVEIDEAGFQSIK